MVYGTTVVFLYEHRMVLVFFFVYILIMESVSSTTSSSDREEQLETVVALLWWRREEKFNKIIWVHVVNRIIIEELGAFRKLVQELRKVSISMYFGMTKKKNNSITYVKLFKVIRLHARTKGGAGACPRGPLMLRDPQTRFLSYSSGY